MEIAQMRADRKIGMPYKEISEKYSYSVPTIRKHCKKVEKDLVESGGVDSALQKAFDDEARKSLVVELGRNEVGLGFVAKKLKALAESIDERIQLGAIKEINAILGVRTPEKGEGGSSAKTNVLITTPVVFLPQNARFKDGPSQ
jgi:predicted transcriptional regulator